MTTDEMLEALKNAGYSLALIAAQSGVEYHNLYRHSKKTLQLSPEDDAAVRRFAIVQPCISARK